MENESSTWYTIYQTIWVSVGLDSYLGTNFAAAVDELIKVDDRFFFFVSVFFVSYTQQYHTNCPCSTSWDVPPLAILIPNLSCTCNLLAYFGHRETR